MSDYASQVTLYHNIFLGCGIAALCFFALAILLFFVLKIPRVFGELTGRVARKAIEEMKEENGYTGRLTPSGGLEGKKKKRFGRKKQMTAEMPPPETPQSYPGQPGAPPAYPGQAANPQSYPGQPGQPGNGGYGGNGGNAYRGDSETTLIDQGAGETTVINEGAGETVLMREAQTDVLNRSTLPGAGGTQTNVLPQNEPDYGTVLLTQPATTDFVILRSIVEVHAEEVVL